MTRAVVRDLFPPAGLSPDLVRTERASVVAEAWSWLGTPYHHAGRVKHVGVDCIQFLAACYEAARVLSVAAWPEYSREWFLHRADPVLVNHLARYCVQLESGAAVKSGDVVTFRFGRHVSHAGVALGDGNMLHAMSGHGVTLDTFGPRDPYGPRYMGAWRPARWAAVEAAA